MDLPEGALENITDASVALEETSNPTQQNIALHPVVSHVKERFQRSKNQRQQDEIRWLEAYRNYRGIYGPDVAFTDTEKSRIFVKVTKTKVMAAFAQICDVLFAGGKFPLGIEPTPVPEGIEEVIHIELEERAKPLNGGTALTTRPELADLLPKSVKDLVDPEKVREGPGKTPTSATFDPAKHAAMKMEKKIHDQLAESDADKHLRTMAFEMSLFGTGIMKGPFSVNKEYPKWTSSEAGAKYEPTIKTIPKITSVSIWNFYPDAMAHSMGECEYAIERHKMSAHQLRQLKKRPAFRAASIDEAIGYGPDYHPEYWENILEDNNVTPSTERYEVLEYWGMIDKDSILLDEIELGDEFDDVDEVQVNIWVVNNTVIRLVVNPYIPTLIPYYATPYEVNPYSFFGVGVAENMADTQLLMNGAMRMTVDNLALSGNLIFEVNETSLAPGQDYSLHPGKMFRTTGASNQQAIRSVKFDNVTQELLAVYEKARQLTDESTNMPSYAHGGTGVQGMGRTASGMSMLMGAAAQSIKSIIRNIDDYFLAPIGRSLFAFNMQFDHDPEIKGDLDIVARGTDSLMRNEIRSQRLLQFLQTGTQNPATAPLVKVDYILKELAASLELDPDRVVNNASEMMIQADLIKKMSEAMGVNTKPTGGAGGAPATSDPTGNGGGNIAPGNAPEPGAAGFTGAGGGANGGQQPAPQQG